jgi:hypothetical protein
MSLPWMQEAAEVAKQTFHSPSALSVLTRSAEAGASVVTAFHRFPRGEYHSTFCKWPAVLDARVREAVSGHLMVGAVGLALWGMEQLEDEGKRLVVELGAAGGAKAFVVTLEKRVSGEVVQIQIPGGRRPEKRERGEMMLYVPNGELKALRAKIHGPYTVGIGALCEWSLDRLQKERLQLVIK